MSLHKKLYITGLYSNINITINGKRYDLHKEIIEEIEWFKSYIQNTEKMPNNNEIEILINEPEKIKCEICDYHIDVLLRYIYDKQLDHIMTEFDTNIETVKSHYVCFAYLLNFFV